MAVGVIARDSVIISVGLIMVGMVSIELAKGLTEVKAIRAVAVDLIRILIRFIVINWKRKDRLT